MTANGDEHEDPLHIRPYVSLPEDGGIASPDGMPEGGPGDGAETTALPDLSPFARQGTAETAELPVVSRTDRMGHVGHAVGSAGSAAAAGPAGAARTGVDAASDADGFGQAPRSHRRARAGGTGGRRRPTTGLLAAAGVAAALGAGLLTTQALTGDRGGEGSSSTDDRALDERPTGAPTHGLASDPASPSPSRTSAKPSKTPSSLPSRTSAPATPRADRNDDAHTEREAKPSPSTSSRKSGEGAESSPSEERSERRHERRQQRPERPGGGTLGVGDSGPGVADLQRRLKQVGYLPPDVAEDGVYSSTVQEGVFRYQTTYRIDEDEPGAYGPYTRRSLESRT